MDSREETKRHAVTFAICAFSAIVVWVVFHGIYANLSLAAAAVGYLDSSARMAIFFSYFAMVAGTSILGIAAAWAGVRALLCLSRRKHS
ncbi:MAG TPA: hypothetical protein VFE36_00070 [Candidatus Baltobacteraceae bacterium]|nr:hypothetical protein [Candidatus Baltobacteraceae bacterium]